MTAPGAHTALEDLAAALDPGEFATALVTGTGRRPCLTVIRRIANVAEHIYADDSAYWWGWAERICAADDPLAAADQVAAVLRAASEPAHDR